MYLGLVTKFLLFYYYNKYKKQLNDLSRDGRAEKYTNKTWA